MGIETSGGSISGFPTDAERDAATVRGSSLVAGYGRAIAECGRLIG